MESWFVLGGALALKETTEQLQSTCIKVCLLPVCALAEPLVIMFPDDY